MVIGCCSSSLIAGIVAAATSQQCFCCCYALIMGIFGLCALHTCISVCVRSVRGCAQQTTRKKSLSIPSDKNDTKQRVVAASRRCACALQRSIDIGSRSAPTLLSLALSSPSSSLLCCFCCRDSVWWLAEPVVPAFLTRQKHTLTHIQETHARTQREREWERDGTL